MGALFNLLTLVLVLSVLFLGLQVVIDTPLLKGDDSPTGTSLSQAHAAAGVPPCFGSNL